jgi:HK97 gp10 family phage protein
MFEVEVSSRGLELSVVANEFSVEVAQRFIERLAKKTEAIMFFEAPWKTGKLAQSIVKQVDNLEANVGPLVLYAGFVETGTSPHEIRPIRARVLAFKSAEGKMVFSSLVHYPGTKANPFMHRTLEQVKENASAVFSDVWGNFAGDSSS